MTLPCLRSAEQEILRDVAADVIAKTDNLSSCRKLAKNACRLVKNILYYLSNKCRVVREVDGAALEMLCCLIGNPGFESLTLRQKGTRLKHFNRVPFWRKVRRSEHYAMLVIAWVRLSAASAPRYIIVIRIDRVGVAQMSVSIAIYVVLFQRVRILQNIPTKIFALSKIGSIVILVRSLALQLLPNCLLKKQL